MMQLDLFPTDAHLTCIDPAQNKLRYYAMSVQPTLFGEWALVRQWGRIGSPGRLRHDHFPAAGRHSTHNSTLRAGSDDEDMNRLEV